MPKIRTYNHHRVKVGQTIVEFIDGIAEVSADIASVLLSLYGENKQPEYFLVEEEKKSEKIVQPDTTTQPNKSGNGGDGEKSGEKQGQPSPSTAQPGRQGQERPQFDKRFQKR